MKSKLPPNVRVDPNFKPRFRPITEEEMNAERARQKAADKAARERIMAKANPELAKFREAAEAKNGVPLTPAEKEQILTRAREIEKERAAKTPAER